MVETRNVDAAIRRLQQKREGLFCIPCRLSNPHLPWYVPQEYFDMFSASEVTRPVPSKNNLDELPEPERLFTGGKSRFVRVFRRMVCIGTLSKPVWRRQPAWMHCVGGYSILATT